MDCNSLQPGTRNPEPGTSRSGFTLVELMVAMFVTIVLGTIVVMAYNTSMQSYYRTERQLQALAAFRNTTDRLEREVNSIVCKSSVYSHPVAAYSSNTGHQATWYAVLWDTRIKYIHGDAWINSDSYAWTQAYKGSRSGTATPALNAADYWLVDPGGRSLYQVNFRPRYMGYYSSLDGFTIDRTEWYFNPPEERRLWANGLDDDGDDPDGDVGLRILYDDQGCLMFRKKFDADMVWREWDTAVGSPNEYRDKYNGPYSGSEFPPQDGDGNGEPDELEGPLVNWDADGDGDVDADDKKDTGTVIGEGFSDLRFYYLYKLPDSDEFVYADWWPWDDDNDPTNLNGKDNDMPKKYIACRVGGSWDIGVSTTGTPNAAQWHGDPARRPTGADQTSEGFDICYFSMPLAISAKFTFQVGRHRHVYEKLVYLHSSRWLKYLNP